jgi:purine-binding chemotaxis protein CheW
MDSNREQDILKETLAKEGKYLTFALDREEYGIEILQVREIIGLMEITSVPQVPAYVLGVINLRGKIIPVIDLRLKFGIAKADYTSETCIIIVDAEDVLMGVLVDKVCEVLEITKENIEPTPCFGARTRADFIKGMGKVAGQVKILLDIEKILFADIQVAEQWAQQKT